MRYQRQIQAVRKRGRRNAHRYPTAKDKTARAFAAYADLCEAAEYLPEQMRGQLATFDLSTFQFRLLATLLHNGAQYERAIAHQFQCSRQNVARVIKSLERRGAWSYAVSPRTARAERVRRRAAVRTHGLSWCA